MSVPWLGAFRLRIPASAEGGLQKGLHSHALIVPLAGEVDRQVDHALVMTAASLDACGSTTSSIAHLDALLRYINAERLFLEKAHALFSDGPPALYVTGAALVGINEVSLRVIAV